MQDTIHSLPILFAWLHRLGYAIGAIVFAILVIEYSLRFALPRYWRAYPWTPNLTVEMEILQEVLPQLEARTRFCINSDGERGDEPPNTGEDCYRVLIVGDSIAEAWFVDQGTNWGALLQSELSRPDAKRALGATRVHVGNVARSHTTCRQMVTMLDAIRDRYRDLDLLIVVPGASDAILWSQHRAPPKWPPEPDVVPLPFAQHGHGPFAWSLKKSAIYQWLAGTRNRLVATSTVRTQCGKSLQRVREMRQRGTRIDTLPDDRGFLAAYERDLAHVCDRARSMARRVLVATPPWVGVPDKPKDEAHFWNYGFGDPYRESVHEYLSSACVDALMQRVADTTMRVARAKGLETCALRDTVDRTFESFYDRLHLTPKGCRQVATALVRTVLNADVAEPRSVPR
ncbi:MAG: hypothetical protein KDC95_07360 [Planctomycetes bacterium]|nr:hypothetical protein [Planctomycetota bacterium]